MFLAGIIASPTLPEFRMSRIVTASILVGSLLALPALLSCGSALAQDSGTSPPQGDAIPLEKRVAKLERQLSSLLKEIQELRRELQAQPKVTVIPVEYYEASEVTHILQEIYQGRPAFLAEPLPKLKCVAIRADLKTTEEAKDVVRRMDESARRAAKENLKIVSPHEIDPDAVEEAVRRLQKLMSPKKK
jgi:hypothetical protein